MIGDALYLRSTDAHPICSTSFDDKSKSYEVGRTDEQKADKELSETIGERAKVSERICSTPPNPHVSLRNQYVEVEHQTTRVAVHPPTFGPQNGILIPCPSAIFEASSALSEGNSLDRTQADRTALTVAGFATWHDLAAAHADRISTALDRLPAPCDAAGKRLLDLSRWFVGRASWVACIANGWPLSDVFGVAEWAPHQRRDVIGLVPAVAFAPKRGRKIVAVTAADATLRDTDGRSITFRRPSLNAADLVDVVPWWQSPVLVNASEAA